MSINRFMTVNLMSKGVDPQTAAFKAIGKITDHYLNFVGAIVAVSHTGEFGMMQVPYTLILIPHSLGT